MLAMLRLHQPCRDIDNMPSWNGHSKIHTVVSVAWTINQRLVGDLGRSLSTYRESVKHMNKTNATKPRGKKIKLLKKQKGEEEGKLRTAMEVESEREKQRGWNKD